VLSFGSQTHNFRFLKCFLEHLCQEKYRNLSSDLKSGLYDKRDSVGAKARPLPRAEFTPPRAQFILYMYEHIHIYTVYIYVYIYVYDLQHRNVDIHF